MADSTPKLKALHNIEDGLINELIMIRRMIVDNGGTPKEFNDGTSKQVPAMQHEDSGKKQKLHAEGIPIGKKTWDDYIDIVGDLLGDARSSQVVSYMVKANPTLPEQRITDAVKTGLTKKVKSGHLPFTPGPTRKAGYTYHFKNRPKMKAA